MIYKRKTYETCLIAPSARRTETVGYSLCDELVPLNHLYPDTAFLDAVDAGTEMDAPGQVHMTCELIALKAAFLSSRDARLAKPPEPVVRTFYGWKDQELINCDTLEEAVEAYIDEWESGCRPGEEITEFQTFYQYRAMEAGVGNYSPLNDMLERLNEEYLPVDFDEDEPTDSMRQAEIVFMTTILREYKVRNLESIPGSEQTINLREWLKVNPR